MPANVVERLPAGGTNTKLVCTLILTLVFLAGAAVGAVAMDLGIHKTRSAAFETPQGKTAYFERMQKELELTPQQSEQMQSVLNELWYYYRNVVTDSKQRCEQLLNEQQRAKFEKILQQQAPR
jgi:Spy/CpxP family protein refolding chaperone